MKKIAKPTACVHAGTARDPRTRGLNSPIHTSSAYGYIGVEKKAYPRYFNTPNQENIVKKLCALEGAEDGLFLSSGMAAVSTAILGLMKQGDHIIFQGDIYGGTHFMVARELDKLGLAYTFVSSLEAAEFAAAIRPNTRLIYIETPSNPLLKIIDIRAIAALAQQHGLISLIDNTFASPINQNPIALGIDVVLHSGTKYISGHSDLCCGAIVSRRELMEPIRHTAVNLGGSLNAQTCYLIERSMKTLSLRVEQQNKNAMQLASFLQQQPEVNVVHYPGLPSHPSHELAASQMSGFGGMLSFELNTREPEPFLAALSLISPAMSLGGVETTICAPAQTSHVKMSRQEREAIGVGEGLLRLSVGIEQAEDLMEDISQALVKSGLRSGMKV